eukprot:365293-Chlamydomonas_euryale.AAC.13
MKSIWAQAVTGSTVHVGGRGGLSRRHHLRSSKTHAASGCCLHNGAALIRALFSSKVRAPPALRPHPPSGFIHLQVPSALGPHPPSGLTRLLIHVRLPGPLGLGFSFQILFWLHAPPVRTCRDSPANDRLPMLLRHYV